MYGETGGRGDRRPGIDSAERRGAYGVLPRAMAPTRCGTFLQAGELAAHRQGLAGPRACANSSAAEREKGRAALTG